MHSEGFIYNNNLTSSGSLCLQDRQQSSLIKLLNFLMRSCLLVARPMEKNRNPTL